MREYLADVRDRYNGEKKIWPKNNAWSSHSHESIKKFLKEIFGHIPIMANEVILNVGSAGNSYIFDEKNVVHFDIANKKLSPPNSVVGTATLLPFKKEIFDNTICVGSVLNYCDPLFAIKELARVTKQNGYIVFDYDSSSSWEFAQTGDYCKASTFVKTFYNGKPDHLFVYSIEHVKSICNYSSLKILKQSAYHVLSSLSYKLTGNEQFSGRVGKLDMIASKISLLKNRASTIIIFCQKI